MIIDNYILINRESELNQKLINHLSIRLSMFLGVSLDKQPILLKSDYLEGARACYDSSEHSISFGMENYRRDSSVFRFNIEDIRVAISEDPDDYNYIIPLSDVYHELIHAYQYRFGYWDSTWFIEGSDEIYTYFLTGQLNIDYQKEVTALWYIARKLLNLSYDKFYLFIKDLITDEFAFENYSTGSRKIARIASDNDMSIKEIKKVFFNYVPNKWSENFADIKKDLEKVHNIIFYRW